MNAANSAIDAAISEADRLRRNLKKNNAKQVNGLEERGLVRATAQAWFNNHRGVITQVVDRELLEDSDELYKWLILAGDRATTRSKYYAILKNVRKELLSLRECTIGVSSRASERTTRDDPPNFSSLIPDEMMQNVLADRWSECLNCIDGNSPLAATVMMGGLLEGLLLARINRETNKATIFKASRAPKDKLTGKPLPLKEWTLRSFINVAHELGWISQSARDVGAVLRDYRNYIHPEKQLSHNIVIDLNDARLFWEITKSISRQIL